jgi:hypothetical protein
MMITVKDIAFDVANAKNKTYLSFPGPGTIRDVVSFGVSFVESEDHFVSYILAQPDLMKDILCGFPDSVLDPDAESLGRLLTARLIVTRKFKKNQIVFANEDWGVILVLDITNLYKTWED